MMENNENKKVEDIEVVIGDDSVLNISEVGDCMNELRPKASDKKNKQVIIPKTKKKEDNEENS